MKGLPSTSGIYTITNKVSNKIYVGCTSNLRDRHWDHWKLLSKNKHPNRHLQLSWNKYGKENLIYEVLEQCEEQFLYSQEHYWCNLLNTHNDNFGYNIKPTNPHSIGGMSQETKRKISKAHTGKEMNWTKRAVLQFDPKTGNLIKKWDSIKDAANFINVSPVSISSNCRGRCPTTGGYVWKYAKNYTENTIPILKKKYFKTVYQYTSDKKLINIFESTKEASIVLNIRQGTISESIRNNWKAFGFYFKQEKINEYDTVTN